MKQVRLSIDGLSTGRLGLGSWALGGGRDWGDTPLSEAADTIAAALEQGINLFDTSPIYAAGRAEELLGRVLKGKRTQVLLATKCGICVRDGRPDHDLRPQSILAECEASLRRLQTDYIDLYQLHWPDPQVPAAQALQTLLRLQEQGKIRAIGICNFPLTQLRELGQIAPISTVQGPYSLLDNSQAAVSHFCRQRGISFWAYGALGGGILSGKYKQEPNLRRCDARRYFYHYYKGDSFAQASQVAARVRELAACKRVPPAALALAWVLAAPGVGQVLFGARSVQQVQQNVQALSLNLTPQEQAFLAYGTY